MAEIKRHSEEDQKVVLTTEDIKNIEEFFQHFQVPMPSHLTEVIKLWKETPADKITFNDQKRLRAFLAHTLTTSDHPLIKDAVFANILKLCDKAWYEEQFHMDLEDELVQPSSSGLTGAAASGSGET